MTLLPPDTERPFHLWTESRDGSGGVERFATMEELRAEFLPGVVFGDWNPFEGDRISGGRPYACGRECAVIVDGWQECRVIDTVYVPTEEELQARESDYARALRERLKADPFLLDD